MLVYEALNRFSKNKCYYRKFVKYFKQNTKNMRLHVVFVNYVEAYELLLG